MKKYDLITPEGTKDYLFEECEIRRETEHNIHEIFRSKGYTQLMTPGLEFYDVFHTKAEYFPQESLYKLTDSKGRLLVLRPDSTIPIARVVSTRLKDAVLPLRLFYNQSVYRFEPTLKGRSDETIQAGIELIGSYSHMADLELIATAIEVLSTCSDGNFSLEIGDAGVFKELMQELHATPEQAENIRYLIETKNYPALNDLLDAMGNDKITVALKQLPSLFGGEEVFEKASKLYSNARIDEILEDLKRTYEEISNVIGTGHLMVDLGMVHKQDYYTGVIIRGYLEGYGEEVLSGGRYNKLLADFGYDVPAIGFAVNVDAVSKILLKNTQRTRPRPDALVFAEPGYEVKAIAVSAKLRKEGKIVEHALHDDLESVRAYAKENGIQALVIVNEDVTEVQE